MSMRSYGRPRRPAYREPPQYRPGEIVLRAVGFAALALTAFLIFKTFAG